MIKRIDTLEGLIEKVLNGQRPTITFKFDPTLTKELTLTLYRWILCSHLYLHYEALHKYLLTNEDINAEEFAKLTEDLEPVKIKRRY